MIRDFPVFVPCGREHLAAVITVPDGPARGLTLLMTGAGPNRGHRFRAWTRAAERLASRGIASVRFDYGSTGESTGRETAWRAADLPVDEALAVTRFAMRATGIQRVAVAGSCLGAWTALELAAEMPECLGLVFMPGHAPILGLADRTTLGRGHRRRKRVRGLRRVQRTFNKLLRIISAPWRRRLSWRLPHARALDHARILFLFGQREYAPRGRARADLEALTSELSPDQAARCEVRVLSIRSLRAFHSLETRDAMIDAIVGWTDELFAAPDRKGRPVTAEPSGLSTSRP